MALGSVAASIWTDASSETVSLPLLLMCARYAMPAGIDRQL